MLMQLCPAAMLKAAKAKAAKAVAAEAETPGNPPSLLAISERSRCLLPPNPSMAEMRTGFPCRVRCQFHISDKRLPGKPFQPAASIPLLTPSNAAPCAAADNAQAKGDGGGVDDKPPASSICTLTSLSQVLATRCLRVARLAGVQAGREPQAYQKPWRRGMKRKAKENVDSTCADNKKPPSAKDGAAAGLEGLEMAVEGGGPEVEKTQARSTAVVREGVKEWMEARRKEKAALRKAAREEAARLELVKKAKVLKAVNTGNKWVPPLPPSRYLCIHPVPRMAFLLPWATIPAFTPCLSPPSDPPAKPTSFPFSPSLAHVPSSCRH